MKKLLLITAIMTISASFTASAVPEFTNADVEKLIKKSKKNDGAEKLDLITPYADPHPELTAKWRKEHGLN